MGLLPAICFLIKFMLKLGDTMYKWKWERQRESHVYNTFVKSLDNSFFFRQIFYEISLQSTFKQAGNFGHFDLNDFYDDSHPLLVLEASFLS